MQKAEADSSTCESFKTNTPANLTPRRRTFKVKFVTVVSYCTSCL